MSGRLQGQRAWLWQRLSAIYLLAYLLYFLGYLIIVRPADYFSWSAWMQGTGLMPLLSCLFFLTLAVHAWVGGRDIIIDYVHVLGGRLLLFFLLIFFLSACFFWAARIFLMGVS